MDRPLSLPRHVPLVVTTRGDAVESVHYGSLAVVDAAGRLIAAVGDVQTPVFTRSTLKPFQALPFVMAGGPAHFGFTPAQTALLCASHSGEPRQVAAVADMLARSGCRESDLQCGTHVPLFYAATGTPAPPDLVPGPLQHNCSGKHAGFLAWCRQHGQPISSYLDPAHPLQQAIRQALALVADGGGERGMDAPMGIDGCSAPNYAWPLASLAHAYAQLAAGAERAESSPTLRPALAQLSAAMRAHPEMVSGERRNDAFLMLAAAGDWVAKGGAEGVQAIGIRSRGIGIALKIADGSPRALQTVIAAVIDRLALLPPSSPALPALWRSGEIHNQAGRLTGRWLPVFELAERS